MQKHEATIIRIKRKRTDDAMDALLVANPSEKAASSSDKRPKHTNILSSKVFRLIESIPVTNDESVLDSSVKLAAARFRSTANQRDRLTATIEQNKQVLAATKLQQAKNARFKIVAANRKLGVDRVCILDAERDEYFGVDEAVATLLPMVHDYLSISTPTQPLPVDSGEYVFDLYYHDHNIVVHTALNENHVGTLAWRIDDDSFVDDGSSHDGCSSDNSNDENHFANDYPDEDYEEGFRETGWRDDSRHSSDEDESVGSSSGDESY